MVYLLYHQFLIYGIRVNLNTIYLLLSSELHDNIPSIQFLPDQSVWDQWFRWLLFFE